MTISSSYSFTASSQSIIRMGLQFVGVLTAGSEPDAGQMTMGLDLLNVGIKALQNEGIELEAMERVTTALVAGQAPYTLAADTLDVDPRGAYASNGSVDLQMLPISRAQYMILSQKSTQSQPTQFYVEKGTINQSVTVYLYPVPDSTWTSFTVARVRLLRDATTLSDTLDFPAKYMRTLAYMVGADFALHYGLGAKQDALRGLYETEKRRAIGDDQEHGPVVFRPSYGIRFGGRY